MHSCSVPPVPQYAPRLTDRGHNFLIIDINAELHNGDGPVVSTKLLYKPAKRYQSWMSVEGKRIFFNSLKDKLHLPTETSCVSVLD